MSTENFATFDNMDSPSIDEFATFDNMSNEEETSEPKEEKVKDDLKVLKNSEADEEGKVIKEDDDKKESKPKKEKKEEKEEKEEPEDKEDEDKEESEEEEKSEEEKLKESKIKSKLRMKMGDELYNVDPNATFRVKVDGENQDVNLQELINNYSGKTAWDKKFHEIGKEKKVIEAEKNTIMKERNSFLEHVNNALAPLKDPNKNPMDSLMYLVEISGEDPYTAYRRIMEANIEEIGNLLDMSETERELHFHKKKDELYGNIAKKRQARQQEELSFNQRLEKVDKLRQARGVSEDQYVEASEELESLLTEKGLKAELTEEDIVDYASLKPHISKVQKLVEPFAENIAESKYGDLVANLSKGLRDGELNEKAIVELLKRNFSVDEEVKELNTKVYQKSKTKSERKVEEDDNNNKWKSFDDF